MTTVKITRTASGFVNVPASYRIGDHDDGADSHVSVSTYQLPAGYRLGEPQMGEQAIYDARGCYCDIVEHSSGRPQIVTDAREMPVLARVGD